MLLRMRNINPPSVWQEAMEATRVLKAVRSQQLEDMRLADNRVGREITHLKAQFELEKRRMVSSQFDGFPHPSGSLLFLCYIR